MGREFTVHFSMRCTCQCVEFFFCLVGGRRAIFSCQTFTLVEITFSHLKSPPEWLKFARVCNMGSDFKSFSYYPLHVGDWEVILSYLSYFSVGFLQLPTPFQLLFQNCTVSIGSLYLNFGGMLRSATPFQPSRTKHETVSQAFLVELKEGSLLCSNFWGPGTSFL